MTKAEINKYYNSRYSLDDVDDWDPNDWEQNVEDSLPQEDEPILVIQLMFAIDIDVDLVDSLEDVDDKRNEQEKGLMDLVGSLDDINKSPKNESSYGLMNNNMWYWSVLLTS